jgi:xanthine dehydrogenase accessory factor
MDDIYQEIVRVKAEGGEAALVTVVSASGSTPREEGAKMLVRPDGSIFGTIGGGSLEARVIKEAIGVIRQGKPKHYHFTLTAEGAGELGMICGGDTEVFIEPILTQPTLYIFGGGHIALALAKMGRLCGFKIAVIDDRPEFASAERFPEADVILAEKFAESCPKLTIDGLSYIVIVTHGHKHDEVVLEWAVGTPARYIGMIGSKTKNETLFKHLRARGVSQEQLDRAHAPIGLEIGAQTPEEIAVSILAEVIKVRRSG